MDVQNQTPPTPTVVRDPNQNNNIVKPAVITFGVILALGVAIYTGFRISQSKPGGMVLPAGTTYLGSSPTSPPTWAPSITPTITPLKPSLIP